MPFRLWWLPVANKNTYWDKPIKGEKNLLVIIKAFLIYCEPLSFSIWDYPEPQQTNLHYQRKIQEVKELAIEELVFDCDFCDSVDDNDRWQMKGKLQDSISCHATPNYAIQAILMDYIFVIQTITIFCGRFREYIICNK